MAHLTPHHLLPAEPFPTYRAYLDAVGGAPLDAASLDPDAIIAELDRAGLRGRGGAGFPTGVKWRGVQSHPCPTRYVVCNAAEGEPGTFKDRWLLRRNPYAALEGMLVAAQVVSAEVVYIAIKGSFVQEIARLSAAIDDLRRAGVLGGVEVNVVEGPEEYLFGEEKALLEVVEGNDPLPREPHYPPYEKGLFATNVSPNPAIVNNVETFAHVPSIVRLGGASFREVGTHDTPGTVVFTVSGDVARPGIYELPAGMPLRRIFDEIAGGPREGRRYKAAISGVSSNVIPADKFDVAADFASLSLIGAGLGSAGFVVLDDRTSMPRVAQAIARFLYVESCNQCSACKHGLRVASSAIDELFDPALATPDDFERAFYGARHAPQGNRCYLPVQGSIIVPGIMSRYHDEFDAQLAHPADAPPPYLVPKMVDFDEATRTFSYDTTQPRKRPNWTYEPEPPPAPPPVSRRPTAPRPAPEVPATAHLAKDVRAALAAHVANGEDLDRLVNDAVRAHLAARARADKA